MRKITAVRSLGAIHSTNIQTGPTSKGGPVFSKLFRLNRTDPLSFGPKFPEILVEWIAPFVSVQEAVSPQRGGGLGIPLCA